jgi:hypothetical protein
MELIVKSGAPAITKMLRVGGRLAVLGIANLNGEPDISRWHVMQPGTWTAPQIGGAGNAGLTVGRTLCGRHAQTNGYAQDYRPPDGALCPACSERL